jgi:nucleoside-diphosphate-sugar epimerase
MILVTGGTGLVGSHLLFALISTGKRVKALKRKSSNLVPVKRLFNHYSINGESLFDQIEWIEGDVEDYQSLTTILAGVNEVYHCAAIVSFSKLDYTRMLECNVGGTANLVDACINAKVKKFCHISSIAALGDSINGSSVDETSFWGKSKGRSGYSVSKFRSEMEVWRGIEMGLNAVIVNPSVIVGPGRWDGGSGNLFGAISKGFPFYTLGVTGYVDARDVAKAMIAAMEKGAWGKRFVLNSENLSYKEVFSMAAKSLGKKPPRIEAKPWMSNAVLPFIWLAGCISRKAPTVTRSTMQSSYKKTYYSSELARNELGINFIPVSEAIENAVKAGRF